MHRIRPFAALCAAALLFGCDDPLGGKQDREPLPIALGVAVQDRIAPGEADEFVAEPAGEFRILFRATSGSPADTLVAELLDAGGRMVAQVASYGLDADWHDQATAWLQPPQGSWRIRVRGRGADDGGTYTLRLFPRNSAPESAPAAITLGRAIEGEALDGPGDMDEFTLEGTAGDEWIVFAQSDARFVEVQLIEAASGEPVTSSLRIAWSTDALEQYSTGRVRLPRSGTYVVRVGGDDPHLDRAEGGYRLRVDRVDRAPEAAAGTLAPGVVLEEAIQSVGDVDEFTFTGGAGQEIIILVQLQRDIPEPIRVDVLHGDDHLAFVDVRDAAASVNEAGTRRIVLPASGTYTVRVWGPAAGMPADLTPEYRLELVPVDRRPEGPGEVRVDGPAVSGTTHRPGDVDEFPVAGTEGQLVMLYGQGTGGTLKAELIDPRGTVVSELGLTGGRRTYAYRTALAATGTYLLRVGADDEVFPGVGDYTVGFHSISTTPEHTSPALAPGETVTRERIDGPGDVDVFTLRGTPGTQVNVFLSAPADALVAMVGRTAGATTYFAYTHGNVETLDGPSTGRITLDSSTYQIKVHRHVEDGALPETAVPYVLRVFAIDRRPEARAPGFALGDTVRGEALYPTGDVDDYTFRVAAETTVGILWEGETGSWGRVVGYLRRDGGAMPIWTSRDYGPVREITLQPGTYHLAVQEDPLDAGSDLARVHTTAPVPYRFAFIPK